MRTLSSRTGPRARRAGLAGVTVLVLTAIGAGARPAAAADPSPYPGGQQPEAATYGVGVDPVVMVPMDDGANIRLQVFYPKDLTSGARAPGPFPVLLTQTPYSTNLAVTANSVSCDLPSQVHDCPGSYFVQRGYIVVQSDQRGTGLSGGAEWGVFGPRDGKDGAAVVRWIASSKNIPGSNGVVGLWGCSALGISQLVTASYLGRTSGHDHPVKAMFPGCISGGMYRDTAFDNGIVGFEGALYNAAVATDAAHFPMGVLINQTPSFPYGPGILLGQQQAYEQQFWKDRKWADQASDIVKSGIPAAIYVGWQEGGHIGGVDIYAQLQNAFFGRDPHAPMPANGKVTGRYQLFIGDGPHGCCLGDEGVQLLWFDHWLKGRDTGVDDRTSTPLHMQEIGTERYVNLTHYPITTDYTVYRLGDGTLGPTAPADGTDSLLWGPPALPGTLRTYTTAPLTSGGTIAGAMSMTVYASSSNTNLQLLATLSDVAPDGTVTTITHGSLLGSLSDLDQTRTWKNDAGVVYRPYPLFQKDIYKPAGALTRYDWALQQKLYSVAPGHKLQLTLSTQGSADACAVTGGIGPPPLGCFYTAPQASSLPGGTYTIERSSAHPSALNLPLLAYKAFPTVASGVTPTSGGEVVPRDWGSLPTSGTHTTKTAAPRSGGQPATPVTAPGRALAATGLGSAPALIALGLVLVGAALAGRRRHLR